MHIPDGFLSTTTWVSAWTMQAVDWGTARERQPGDGPVGERDSTAELAGGDETCRRN